MLDIPKKERALALTSAIAAISVVAVVVAILGFLVHASLPIFEGGFVKKFFLDDHWYPTDGLFNIVPMLVASVLLSVSAVLLVTLVSIFASIYLRFYSPLWLAATIRRLLELLSGIPSVVYGLWGIVVVVPMIAQISGSGASLLAGIIVLSLMILPTAVLLIDSAFESIQHCQLEAAYALGLKKQRIILQIALPLIKMEILAAIILQGARAIGETMVVLMVCGNIVQIPSSIFDPVRALTSNMALEMGYAAGIHSSALFFTGLVLLMVVGLLVFLVQQLERKMAAKCC